jgi:RNA polymerase primary sigma factor
MKDALGLYLSRIGKIPLLTAAEEIDLSRKVQAGLSLEEEIPPSDRTSAQQRTIRIGQKARKRMIEANLRMVVSVAKKYAYFNLDLVDLIQEGSLGLNRAVEKFDHTRGYKFSTYAYWWIRQAMTRALDQQTRSIRLPLHISELNHKIRKVTGEFEQTHLRRPSLQEIADILKTTETKIRETLEAFVPISSLHATVGKDDGSTLMDLIADEEEPIRREAFDEGLDESNFNEQMLQCLSERERIVITSYFGIDTEKPMCLSEIGKTLGSKDGTGRAGVSRERTRQIRDCALRKLRFRAGVMRQCSLNLPATMTLAKQAVTA